MVTIENIDFKKSFIVRRRAVNVFKEKYKETIDFIDNAIDKAAEEGLFCVRVLVEAKDNEEINALINLYREHGGFKVTTEEFPKKEETGVKYYINFYW